MYRKLIIAFVLSSIVCMVFLIGCNSNETVSPTVESESNGILSDIKNLKANMKLADVAELIGSPYSDERSSDYPLVYTWIINDNCKLHITFETDDRDVFLSAFRSGEYILEDEQVQYDSIGLRHMTPNEIKVLREWIMDHEAVYAYTVCDGIEEVLFNVRTKE